MTQDAAATADPAAAGTDIWPGSWYPLGATFDGRGVNFSIFSEVAARIELCLFDEAGFRVHGPWDPSRGHRCNPHKLLLDPYARAVEGSVSWNASLLPYRVDPEGSRYEDEPQHTRFGFVRSALGRGRRPV